MRNFIQAFACEVLKARRSRVPVFTAAGFSLAPIAGGFFMVILRDPELARRWGLISAKAQIFAGEAIWPAYLGMLSQAVAVGGIFLFSIVCTWVFGREFSDRTAKDLLALPTPRSAIVMAKFAVVALWSVLLTVFIWLLGLAIGAYLGLPEGFEGAIWQGTLTMGTTACLTLALAPPIAFVASAGRGYLPALGVTILAVIFAQIIAATGWGEYFPWSIPALVSGMGGADYLPGMISYLIVILTAVAGIASTLVWWKYADHTH